MKDIKYYDTFTKVDLINKGWSSDKKYYIETQKNGKFLLRIADISEYKKKVNEFEIMKRLSNSEVNMSQPIDYGICCNQEKVYQLLTWSEGEEAKELLPLLSKVEQYEMGKKAGDILKKLNTVEIYEPSSEWPTKYTEKTNTYVRNYRNCGETFENDELLISFLENNINLISNRPMCLTHEDFQADNLVISPENELYVIDFQQCGIVDPYYALMSAMISADVSPQFATGQIHEYFKKEPSELFWKLITFYFVVETINAFVIAMSLGQNEIDFVHSMTKKLMETFDGLNSFVPSWYYPL